MRDRRLPLDDNALDGIHLSHVLEGVRESLWWRPTGMVVSVNSQPVITNAHSIRLYRKVADGLDAVHLGIATQTEAGAPTLLIERPHELLVTLLVGITVVNIAAAAIAAAKDVTGSRPPGLHHMAATRPIVEVSIQAQK